MDFDMQYLRDERMKQKMIKMCKQEIKRKKSKFKVMEKIEKNAHKNCARMKISTSEIQKIKNKNPITCFVPYM